MSVQINPSVTTPTVAELYKRITNQELNLQPSFQRKFVWTQHHQEEFIDSILNGYPFPEIYVCLGTVDNKTMETTKNVIDGQQRLTTIRNYIDNKFDRPLKKILPYKQLTESQKNAFISYQVVQRDIGSVPDDVVREIFRRINLTKFKLEDIEIHNAIYDGEFIGVAKQIATNGSFKALDIFLETDLSRMADLGFILQVMVTLEHGGYFNGDKEMEKYISVNNEDYPNAEITKSILTRSFTLIKNLDLPPDSIWFRKSSFFTMAVEISKNIEDINDEKLLKNKLLQLEQSIMANKTKENDFGVFYGYMYQGTVGRKARVERARVFCEHVFD